jgi:hypothetical protein
MKFDFDIRTEFTLHAAISIVIVILASPSFTIIAMAIEDPHMGIYCITALELIFWLVLLVLPSGTPSVLTKATIKSVTVKTKTKSNK